MGPLLRAGKAWLCGAAGHWGEVHAAHPPIDLLLCPPRAPTALASEQAAHVAWKASARPFGLWGSDVRIYSSRTKAERLGGVISDPVPTVRTRLACSH